MLVFRCWLVCSYRVYSFFFPSNSISFWIYFFIFFQSFWMCHYMNYMSLTRKRIWSIETAYKYTVKAEWMCEWKTHFQWEFTIVYVPTAVILSFVIELGKCFFLDWKRILGFVAVLWFDLGLYTYERDTISFPKYRLLAKWTFK